MESQPMKRKNISNKEREILEAAWLSGMRSTKNGVLIGRTKEMLNIREWTSEKIKAWIGNRNAKEKQTDQVPVKKYLAKGPSAFNMFCRGKACDPNQTDGKSFKNWAAEWATMEEAAKSEFQVAAKKERENPAEACDKEAVLQKQMKVLASTCSILEDLGCEVGGIVVKRDGQPTVFGSNKGQEFYNIQKIAEFTKSVLGSDRSEERQKEHQKGTLRRVREIFNTAWASASGCFQQVPYKKIKAGLIEIEVLGLPDGILFADPSTMGSTKLERIVAVESVEFRILRQESSENAGFGVDVAEVPTGMNTAEDNQDMPDISGEEVSNIINQSEDNQDMPDISDVEVSNDVNKSEKMYPFKNILKRRKRCGKFEYLVEWESDGPPTWQPENDIPPLFRFKFAK